MHHKAELWLEGLRQGRNMRFKPLGSSMVPFLRHGDLVTILPGTSYRLGDIILFNRGETFVLHRLVAKSAGRIITKGDAIDCFDAPVKPEDILGRAVLRERGGKVLFLDSLWPRLLGLVFCMTVSWVPKSLKILAAMKNLSRKKLGLAFRWKDLP